MFGLFNNSKCPVNEDTRIWIEDSLIELITEFGKENILSKKTMTAEYSCFPVKYYHNHASVTELLKIICVQMEIEYDKIKLNYYSEGARDLSSGLGPIFLTPDPDQKQSAGLYFGKDEKDFYLVGLEENYLHDPLAVIAILAHELSHIKLLGEGRMSETNEHLTDLTTVVFGFGIFNANIAFNFSQGFDGWKYNRLGYLSQMEWGYALAAFSYYKNELNPEWINFLTTNVKSDFKQSMRFILKNKELVFSRNQ